MARVVQPGRGGETKTEREARYAARDVIDKFGIRPGHRLRFLGAVDEALAARARDRAGRATVADGELADVVLAWPPSLEAILPLLREARASIDPAGGIWLITAKRTAVRPDRPYVRDTDVIALGGAAGLVDNKIASVSDSDTSMRFVIRRADRDERSPKSSST